MTNVANLIDRFNHQPKEKMVNKKEALNKLIRHLGRGGAIGTNDDAKDVLGMNINQFLNRLYGRKEQDFMLKHIETLTLESNCPAIAEYFASLTGHVVVELPDADELDKQELYDLEMWVGSLFGELKQTRYHAELDGVYDDEELKQIGRLERKCLSALIRLNMTKRALFTRKKP